MDGTAADIERELALAGALRNYGLVRPDAENMSGFVTSGVATPLQRSSILGSYGFRGRFSRRVLLSNVATVAVDAGWRTARPQGHHHA